MKVIPPNKMEKQQDNLFDMNTQQHKKDLKSNTTTIDFGVGKLTCTIEPGCAITVTEVVEALESVAMTVPLQHIINAINRLK